MSELIDQTMTLVQKSSELLNQTGTEEVVKTAAKGFFSWLSNIFTKNSAKDKLRLIEENKANQDTIVGLKANLEFLLDDNNDLQKKLQEKVQELYNLFKDRKIEGITNNSASIGNHSNDNIIIQGIHSGNKTNFNITR